MLLKKRSIQPSTMPIKPACFSGEEMPEAGLWSFGRSAETFRSGDAAMSSRHGALEPGAGGRAAERRIAAFNFSIAISVGGTMDAVTRLPPEPGPSGRLES